MTTKAKSHEACRAFQIFLESTCARSEIFDPNVLSARTLQRRLGAGRPNSPPPRRYAASSRDIFTVPS